MDGSSFEAGIRRLSKTGTQAFSELKQYAAAAFGGAAIDRMMRTSIDNAAELVNAARRLGTEGTEGLQVMRQAAKDAGVELGTVEKAFEKINVARAKALKGDAGAISALKALGITDLKMSTEKMLMGPLRDKALSMNAQNFQPLLKNLGIKSGEIIPFLKTDFEELGNEMRKLGLVTSDEVAIKLKLLGEGFDLMSKLIATRFGPALLAAAEGLARLFAKGSGAVAGTVGFVQGAVSGDWDWKRMTKLGLGPVAWTIPALNPFDMKAAQAGRDELKGATDAQAKDFFDAYEKRMEKLKHDLENPPAPNFETSGAGKEAKEKAGRGRMDTADSLVRVGNFLGDSQSALIGVAERQLAVLHTIAANTKPRSYASDQRNDPAFA